MYIISAQELKALKECRILSVDGSETYQQGHIPGALPLPLSDIPADGSLPLGASLEALLSARAIEPDTLLVLYSSSSLDAAYLFWLLRRCGHGSLKILDGGLEAWKEAGFEIETLQPPVPKPSSYKFPPQPPFDGVASFPQVKAIVEGKDSSCIILDVRSEEEKSGQEMFEGAAIAGAIPHALWVHWAHCVQEDGRFCPFALLKKRYEEAGVTPDKKITVYCHGGVRAAHTWFVLKHLLGYPHVQSYAGSWKEWSAFAQKGEAPFVESL